MSKRKDRFSPLLQQNIICRSCASVINAVPCSRKVSPATSFPSASVFPAINISVKAGRLLHCDEQEALARLWPLRFQVTTIVDRYMYYNIRQRCPQSTEGCYSNTTNAAQWSYPSTRKTLIDEKLNNVFIWMILYEKEIKPAIKFKLQYLQDFLFGFVS
jgi:hypothetical protein